MGGGSKSFKGFPQVAQESRGSHSEWIAVLHFGQHLPSVARTIGSLHFRQMAPAICMASKGNCEGSESQVRSRFFVVEVSPCFNRSYQHESSF